MGSWLIALAAFWQLAAAYTDEQSSVTDVGGSSLIKTAMMYSTRVLHMAPPKQTATFVAAMCKNSCGSEFIVTIDLKNNPSWSKDDGIVYFRVVGATKSSKGAIVPGKVLCASSKSSPKSQCVIKNFKPTQFDYILIQCTTGDVADVSYSLLASCATKGTADKWGLTTDNSHFGDESEEPFTYYGGGPTLWLMQVVNNFNTIEVPVKGKVILETSYCASPEIGDQYEIISTATAQTPYSTFAQYACSSSSCSIDGSGVLVSNANQLPVNIVQLQASHGELRKVYYMLRCWSADPGKSKGKVIFSSYMSSLSKGTPKPPVVYTTKKMNEVPYQTGSQNGIASNVNLLGSQLYDPKMFWPSLQQQDNKIKRKEKLRK